MKKKSILCLIAIATLLLITSCVSIVSGDLINEVIEVPGKTANELFVESNSWMVDAFVNAESVIQYADKEAGIVKGKYSARLQDVTLGILSILGGSQPTYKWVRTTITIQVQNERVRFILSQPDIALTKSEMKQFKEEYTLLFEDYKDRIKSEVEVW